MTEPLKIEKLLTDVVNASHDCGEWRDQEDFIPSDDTPEWEPYEEVLERSRQAKAALQAHVAAKDAEIALLKAQRDEAAKSAEQSAAAYQDLGATLFAANDKLERECAELRAALGSAIDCIEIAIRSGQGAFVNAMHEEELPRLKSALESKG